MTTRRHINLARVGVGVRNELGERLTRAAYRGTYSYFGSYTVNEADKSFTIKVVGSSYPNEVGTDTTRVVSSISAAELKFSNAAGAGGGKVEATFRRAK